MMSSTKRYDFLLHSNFHPKNVGGVEKVTSQVAKILDMRQKHICHFFGDKCNYTTNENRHQYVAVKIIFSKFGFNLLQFGNFRLLFYALKSKKVIFNDPYPSLWPSIILLKLIGKDMLLIYHATPSMPRVFKPLFKLLRYLIYSYGQAVVTSPVLASELPATCRVKVIPLWLDEVSVDCSVDITLPDQYFLYIGRLSSYKGIDILLKAISKLPEIEFIIAGDGAQRNKVKSYLSNDNLNKDNLIFINRFISEGEKTFLLKNAYALVFPSTNSGEAFGIIQLEATRLGVPIINTKLGTGVNFVGRNGINALTVEPNNVQELQSAILELARDKKLRQRLSIGSAQLYVSEFSSKLSVEKISKMLFKDDLNKSE